MALCCVFLIILLRFGLDKQTRLQLNVNWKRYLAIESTTSFECFLHFLCDFYVNRVCYDCAVSLDSYHFMLIFLHFIQSVGFCFSVRFVASSYSSSKPFHNLLNRIHNWRAFKFKRKYTRTNKVAFKEKRNIHQLFIRISVYVSELRHIR